jgi:uncharacterized protein
VIAERKETEYVSYKCRACGVCCKGYGGIFITRGEMETIAGWLGVPPKEFFDRYCEMLNGKISIKTGKNDYCVFWKDKLCSIHEVKPAPCRKWPFFDNIVAIKDNWEIAKNNCPGFRPDSTYEEFLEDARRFREEQEISED